MKCPGQINLPSSISFTAKGKWFSMRDRSVMSSCMYFWTAGAGWAFSPSALALCSFSCSPLLVPPLTPVGTTPVPAPAVPAADPPPTPVAVEATAEATADDPGTRSPFSAICRPAFGIAVALSSC